ncbi:MAG TPA: hypothetical protein PK544_11480 [Spirochaetota bacterium]|nr:hypothetical protein [Spirochaetota bacterium]HPJ40582.1 hypothetical protein [Spirochaetota bacterium]
MGIRTFLAVPAALIITAVLCSPSYGWFFDRGLEDRIHEMRSVFQRKDLSGLYRRYVNSTLRDEISNSIREMKKDRGEGREIARRLHFRSYSAYIDADANSIVDQFFYTMLHPPARRQRPLNNVYYLKLAFFLSLLFAHCDSGMDVVKKDISGVSAKVYYVGNNLRLVVYYVYKNGTWYLTREGLVR